MSDLNQFIDEYQRNEPESQNQATQSNQQEPLDSQEIQKPSCETQTKDLESKIDILENIPIGIYVYRLENLDDDKTLRMIYANKESELCTGIPVDTIVGKTLDENFPDLRDQGIPSIYADVVRTGQKKDLEDIKYGDGRLDEEWYHVSAFPLLDKCVGVSFTKVTAHKEAEEKLVESEEKFRTISDTAQDGIILTDEHDNVVFWNKAAERIFGYTFDEVIGRNLHQAIAPQFINDEYHKDMHQFRQTGRNRLTERTYELVAQTKQGTPVDIELSLSSFLKKNTYHAVGVVRDITDRKKADQILQDTNQRLEERNKEVEVLLEQKDEFLHILAHDLKNPLSTPMTLLPVLESKVEDEKMKEMITVSMRTMKNMKRIINEALALARLDDPKKELQFTQINVREKVQTVLENNQGLLKKYKFNIETQIDDQLTMMADDFQIEEVFNNLISNAIKYTPDEVEGKIKIIGGTSEEGVWLNITDNGSGLTEEQCEKVFEKFYKTGKPKQGMDSTGLGLGIVKNIIEKHHGRIWVDSPGPGQGSTFHLVLPNEQPSNTLSQ